MSGCKDSSSSRKDRNDSGNELPLDPELREERQGEGGEVWVPMLGAWATVQGIQDHTI